jgi:hypothetical protein
MNHIFMSLKGIMERNRVQYTPLKNIDSIRYLGPFYLLGKVEDSDLTSFVEQMSGHL